MKKGIEFLKKYSGIYMVAKQVGRENRVLGATWEEDGIKYLLFTMKGGFSEEDLLAKAKEVIDVER